ncbi:NAD(P)/FAD-dependent oxidoreductase [Kiloniella laminariae]|uniref:Pyridine nucleotide-disulfide oxidoreductase domain-containing protein 2 n=1 Tax=Kiloniella laminariae TaxID=454162 RepID=A0ABT4LJ00_9PROT|nr:NAD(P)/FAD-dependent oxidoreductase [Kiloniella laminariae]MCZ4281073.1 NAD(P)/FAD-dependent oxidoreductase [Kiloniella laminariae]
MTTRYDTIVIGAGHNGLTCAAYLAKAGKKVLVLEAKDRIGGMAITEPTEDGVLIPTCAHLLYQLHPDVIRDLNLNLKMAASSLPTIALGSDGRHLKILGETLTAMNGADLSSKDQENYTQVMRDLKKFARVLGALLGQKPPRLKNRDWEDTKTLLKLGLSIRMMGRKSMQEFLRIALLNIADQLEDHLENDLLMGVTAMEAVWGTHLAPRSPGSVLSLMYRLAGSMEGTQGAIGIPAGGMGKVSEALEQAATRAGATIRTNAPVKSLLVENDTVIGVELESGEKLLANSVASSADPQRTFLSLLGAEHLDAGFTRRLNKIRNRGDAAKVNLVLDGLPEFNGLSQQDLAAKLVIAPSINYIEKAFNHAKYGEFSEHPALEITLPTVVDPASSRSNKHVLSIVAQYAPYQLKAGWSEEQRADLGEAVIRTLEAYAPNIRKQIVSQQVLTPSDLEQLFNVTGGHWHHLEIQVDQLLMMRPLHGTAQYETPIGGLFLCGAGAHPGGNVTGAPGMNAAQRILSRKG